MLTSISFANSKYDTLLNFKTDSTSLLENGDLLKIYTYPETAGITEKFRIWLYYTKELTDVDYSFSAKLDNEKGYKLYKIRILAGGANYQGFEMPARVYSLLMTRNKIRDTSKLKHFVKMYTGQ